MHVKLKNKEEEIIIHVETGQARDAFDSNVEHRSHLRKIKLARVWVDTKKTACQLFPLGRQSEIELRLHASGPPNMSRGKYLNASSIGFTACGNPAVWAEQQSCLLKPISQLEERRRGGGGEWSRENFGAFLFNSTQKSQRNLPLLCKHTYTHTATGGAVN